MIFIPKPNALRPIHIVNDIGIDYPQTLMSLLQPIRDYLHRDTNLVDVSEGIQRILDFRQKWIDKGKPKVYAVNLDIKTSFHNIDRDKLINLLKTTTYLQDFNNCTIGLKTLRFAKKFKATAGRKHSISDMFRVVK